MLIWGGIIVSCELGHKFRRKFPVFSTVVAECLIVVNAFACEIHRVASESDGLRPRRPKLPGRTLRHRQPWTTPLPTRTMHRTALSGVDPVLPASEARDLDPGASHVEDE